MATQSSAGDIWRGFPPRKVKILTTEFHREIKLVNKYRKKKRIKRVTSFTSKRWLHKALPGTYGVVMKNQIPLYREAVSLLIKNVYQTIESPEGLCVAVHFFKEGYTFNNLYPSLSPHA
jgi:hypothetical protein